MTLYFEKPASENADNLVPLPIVRRRLICEIIRCSVTQCLNSHFGRDSSAETCRRGLSVAQNTAAQPSLRLIISLVSSHILISMSLTREHIVNMILLFY